MDNIFGIRKTGHMAINQIQNMERGKLLYIQSCTFRLKFN